MYIITQYCTQRSIECACNYTCVPSVTCHNELLMFDVFMNLIMNSNCALTDLCLFFCKGLLLGCERFKTMKYRRPIGALHCLRQSELLVLQSTATESIVSRFSCSVLLELQYTAVDVVLCLCFQYWSALLVLMRIVHLMYDLYCVASNIQSFLNFKEWLTIIYNIYILVLKHATILLYNSYYLFDRITTQQSIVLYFDHYHRYQIDNHH